MTDIIEKTDHTGQKREEPDRTQKAAAPEKAKQATGMPKREPETGDSDLLYLLRFAYAGTAASDSLLN